MNRIRNDHAIARLGKARACLTNGAVEDAAKLATDALAIFREVGNEEGKDTSLNIAVQAHLAQNDVATALNFVRGVLASYKEVADRAGQASALRVLGELLVEQGETQEAWVLAMERLALCQEVGDYQGQELALQFLVEAHTQPKSQHSGGMRRELEDLARQSLVEARTQSKFQLSHGVRGELEELALRSLVEAHTQSKFQGGSGMHRDLKELARQSLAEAHTQSKIQHSSGVRRELEDWLAHVRGLGDRKAEAATLVALAKLALTGKESGAASKSSAITLAEQAKCIYKQLGEWGPQANLHEVFITTHLAREEYEEALANAKALVELCRDADEPEQLVGALLAKTHVRLAMEEPERAASSAQEALAVARASADRQAEINVLHSLVKVHFATKHPEQALAEAFAAVELSKGLTDRIAAAASVAKLADLVLRFSLPEEALRLAEEARVLFSRAGDRHGEAEICRTTFAAAQLMLSSTDEAISSAEAALELFRLIGDRGAELRALGSLVRVRLGAGNMGDALQATLELVSVSASAGLCASEAEGRHMVAQIHMMREDHEAALTSAEEAVELYRRLEDKRGEAAVLHTLLQTRLRMNQLDEALRAAERLRAAAEGAGDAARSAQAAQTAADIRISRREFKDVLCVARAEAERCRQRGDQRGEAQQWLVVAKARAEQARVGGGSRSPGQKEQAQAQTKRAMEALMAAKDALHLLRALGDAAGEAAALQVLAKAYQVKGVLPLALEAARDAGAVHRALGDRAGAAQCLLLEATLHAGAAVGVPCALPGDDTAGETYSPSEKEALAAAEEARELCSGLCDKGMEQYAEKVLQVAKDCFRASQESGRQRQQQQQHLVALDVGEQNPLEDLGFQFKCPVEAAELLRWDPRLHALLGQDGLLEDLPCHLPHGRDASTAISTPAMLRLGAVASRSRGGV